MKKLIVGMWLCCASSMVLAVEKIDRSADVDKDVFVKIEHVNGTASIKSWDKNQVRVKGTLGDNTDEFIFEHDNDEVVIKVKVKKNKSWTSWNTDDEDQLEIFVPRQGKVYYDAVNADVEAEGFSGGASIETVNGSIEGQKLAGRIRFESVNGDITASELSGDVKIETVNGDIDSTNSAGREDSYDSVNGDIQIKSMSSEINVESVNGDIELQLGEISQLNANTVNGEIDAHLTLSKNGEVEASSVGGPITLSFQQNVSAIFDIQAHAGGKITNRLSEHKMQKAKYGPSRWLEFSLNNGSGKVNVSTVSGRVKLDKH